MAKNINKFELFFYIEIFVNSKKVLQEKTKYDKNILIRKLKKKEKNKMKIRKILFLIVVLLIILMIPNIVKADTSEEIKINIINSDGSITYKILTEDTVELTKYEGSVTEIQIPSTIEYESNSYKVVSIAERAFWGNNVLETIHVPDSVTSIARIAFNGCINLKEVQISETNTKYSSIDGVLFNADKTKIIFYPEGKSDESYNIPDTVTTIGSEAFYRCSLVEDITIPDSVTVIEDFAFMFSESITDITIPSSVTTIGNRAFSYCYSLKNVTISNSVTSIGWGAFENCKALENIIIPDSITKIEERMFYDCKSLKNITIPDSVNSIATDAFYNCTLLETKIYYVTNSLNNILSNGKNYMLSTGDSYTATLTTIEGYKLPDIITIKIGSDILENSDIYDGKTGKIIIPIQLINSNIEITASGIKKCKVIFYGNGGTFFNGTTNTLTFEDWNNDDYTYNYDSGNNNLEKPVREGYEFLGYFTEKTGGTKIDNLMAEAGIDTDMTFYAQWESIDSNKKGTSNPQTGDNILVYVGICLISIVGLVTTVKSKKIIKKG